MRNYICKYCKARLDAGEKCNCLEVEADTIKKWDGMTKETNNGQLIINEEPQVKKSED